MIEVKNVSMSFRLSQDRIQSIKEYLVALAKGKLKYKEFWALKNVSFTVRPGEVLGIIGRNGAGKSTILKVISGILKPTEGSVSAVSYTHLDVYKRQTKERRFCMTAT